MLPIIILDQPQRAVNIAATVRAMLNTGMRELRLVNPREYDPDLIELMAHRYQDYLAPIQLFDQLETALAGLHTVVGFTSRQRTDRHVATWNELGPSLHATPSLGLVFGREDWGLSNQALEQCSLIAALNIADDYPSLNLASAVLIALYEWQRPVVAALPITEAAPQAEYATTLNLVQQALEHARFNRTIGQQAATINTLRNLLSRARPSSKELKLLQAFAYRVLQRPPAPPE